jgi:hypothetical protein
MIQPLPILPACRQTHSCALAYQHKDKEPAAGKGAPEDRSCHQVICGAVRHAEEGQHCHPHTTPTRHLRACHGLLHALHHTARGRNARIAARQTADETDGKGGHFRRRRQGCRGGRAASGHLDLQGHTRHAISFLPQHPRRQIARDGRTRMKTSVTTADDTVWPIRHLHTKGRGTYTSSERTPHLEK